MPQRVHLIHTGISYYGFGCVGLPGEPSMIHHGLALTGAAARAAGHRVQLTDLRGLRNWEDVRRSLAASKADVVGVTMMSCEFDDALRVLSLAREVLPTALTVAGGPHPTIMPEELEACTDVDVIFRGEGEVTFPQLVTDLAAGHCPDRIVIGASPDLNAIPFAARGLFPAPEMPDRRINLDLPFVTIITGRGCSYNCSFCQPAERMIFGSKVRRRSVDNVMEEMNLLRDQRGFRSLMIHDDCLTEDAEWVGEFCRRYREEGFEAPFMCQSRADIICRHPEMIAAMRDAGLRWVIIGFESGSDRVLRFLRKGCTVAQNLEAGRICRELGLRIVANYMLGLPTETKEEALETVEMIREIKPDLPSAAFYTPHPGSDLFEYCREHDLSLIQSHDMYARYPGKPKIKGVDYQYLERIMRRGVGLPPVRMTDRLGLVARRLKVPGPVRRAVKKLLVR
jgi:radical SAM superfamily enzyme YgiQ (UPF0313 family)